MRSIIGGFAALVLATGAQAQTTPLQLVGSIIMLTSVIDYCSAEIAPGRRAALEKARAELQAQLRPPPNVIRQVETEVAHEAQRANCERTKAIADKAAQDLLERAERVLR